MTTELLERSTEFAYLDCEAIKELIPHRGHWLFLNSATINFSTHSVIASASCQKLFLEGHDFAVPGVIIAEMIHQAAAVLLAKIYQQRNPTSQIQILTMLKRIGEIEFCKPVKLDTEIIRFSCKAVWQNPHRRSCAQEFMGTVSQEGELVANSVTNGIGVTLSDGRFIRV